MLRDTKILRRNENIPIDSSSTMPNLDSDPSRPPLNAIQDPTFRRKVEKTSSKTQTRVFSDAQYWTPEKTKNRFGWAPSSGDSGSSAHLPPLRNGSGCNFTCTTPRNNRTAGKASSVQSDCSSTQSTPTKSSVTKPTLSGFGSSRPPMSVGRAMVSKGMPGAGPIVHVSAEVPHFELREDPSFWMDHNVQVVIRVRPINSVEQNLQGYSRCLKQESAQNITWIGQPETRFTFDYVACETISQEMLFRVAGLPMVENCLSGYNSCMFAYGQTGSGKTYTMLGEIGESEFRPSADRGMTSRIFEFLFARIKAEEESRRDEKLKYNCKCSFLEIYNEQITDLLDPSSTNLLLREDIQKGVYVENLTEFEVGTVSDILKLLFQGTANRKVATTNMNRESSRSHSVFTCVIKSRWEKDSTTNLRFARLNLVDLAGSERQKTSGAEGERLKEAANINKSLSTLGHVIMILADAARGKQRHVPYRDSRLTFLLQESLGGNSKTMIIANISPSICSASETLSTLKFAQRARLIQNNAVVNEDASGDISALQHQIRLLKEELLLLKRQNVSRSLSFRTAIIENSKDEDGDDSVMEDVHGQSQLNRDEMHNFGSCQKSSADQFKSLEATLAGALRREKMAGITIKQLETEIAQLNSLVRQREEDSRSSKMMLKFREDKIHRMEALLDGQLQADLYFSQESNAQSEEIRLLRSRADRNPEVTRFALENIRLLDQLRRFQDFYEEGERELLLCEVAELRNQVILILDGKLDHDQQSSQDSRFQVEPDNMDLCLDSPHSSSLPPYSVIHAEEVLNLQLELDILKIILGEEKSAHIHTEKRAFEAENELRSANERILQHESIENNLKDARSVMGALESQHILSINELEESRETNKQFLELLKKQEQEMTMLKKQIGDIDGEEKVASCRKLKNQASMLTENDDSPLQEKLKKIQASLEKARDLNTRFQTDQVSQTSLEQEKDEIRRQVEVETTDVIVCLQEELLSLQQQVDESNRNEVLTRQNLNTLETELKGLHERLSLVTEENERLECLLGEKGQALKLMSEEWERLAYEIAEVLADGSVSLEDVSDQVASISGYLPSSWVTDKVQKIIRSISEKDSIIDELQKCLDDAQNVKCDMEWKLRSLRGATLAITEAQQKENSEKEREIVQLTSQLSQKMNIISELENNIRLGEERLWKAGICAAVSFTLVNRFSEINAAQLNELIETLKQRDALLQDQILCQVDAENQLQAMKSQLTQFQEQTHRLLIQLEQSQIAVDNQALACPEINDATFSEDKSDNLLEDKVKLTELKMGASKLPSCGSEYAEQVSCPAEEFIEVADNSSEHGIVIESNGDTVSNEQHNIKSVSAGNTPKIASQNKSECILDGEITIALLRKELESALNNLKGVQAKMVKLLDEKEEIKQSELRCQKNIEHLTTEVLRLKSENIDKEQQFDQRLLELDEKLQRLEDSAASANACWRKMKEGLDSEVSNAKAIAAQKTIEASNLSLKIEEVQETMRDADLMVNSLMEANETAKLELERHKSIGAILNHEKSHLTSEVKTLQSSLEVTMQEYMSMKENSMVCLEEARRLFLALEDAFRLLQGTFTEKFKLVESDLNWLKSKLRHNAQSVRVWLEEIWSEIIGKDCAVSVLHLCHMGILLERITGLNTENEFLKCGLCKSNSVVSDLKKHNSKVKQDLELCSILKGKLLVDINNSFNRIKRKEGETTEFKARLNSFEQKILHLQLQEESMLDRSNSMAAELAILIKELDERNRNASTELLAKEQLLKKNEDLNNQLEQALKLLDEAKSINVILTHLLHEEFGLLMFDSQPCPSAKLIDLNTSNINFSKLVKDCRTIKLQNEYVITNMFAKDFQLLVLSSELRQKTMEFDLMALQKLDIERHRETLGQMIEKMKGRIVLNKIDLELRNGEVHSMLIENEIIQNELLKVKKEHSRVNEDLQEQKKMFACTLNDVRALDEENLKLHDVIGSSQTCIARLQADMDKKSEEFTHILKELELKNVVNEIQIKKIDAIQMENDYLKDELVEYKRKIDDDYIEMLRHCYDIVESSHMTSDKMLSMADKQILRLKDKISRESYQNKESASKFIDELNFLELSSKELMSQSFSLRSELLRKDELLKGYLSDLRLLQESASIVKDQKNELDGVLQSLREELEAKSCQLDEGIAHRQLLQSQLLEKNERIVALELERAEKQSVSQSLREELEAKSCQLDEGIAHRQLLQSRLLEKNERIVALELELAEKQSAVESISSENLVLEAHVEHLLETRNSIEEQLREKNKVTEKLEDDMLETSNLLGQRNQFAEDLQDEMIKLKDEKDHLDSLLLVIKEKMEMTHALAEEHEAIATEARQIAEERTVYAADKEEEIKLLERSVEELECTINALENKAEFVRGEAERQRLKREELEMELESVRHQMLSFPDSANNLWQVTGDRNLDMARHLKEKVTELQEAQKHIHVLQKEVADKDAEILQCKTHISELNVHAEAQASEYKQKFKELEAMAQQVKADTISSNPANLTTTKSDKSAAKSRGSGSPFRCIGLGVTQQVNSEKDEDLSAARRQIEELEAVAASRQKEIFMLNTRLAAAESMTHDVIRDLLGVKLDMTSCAAVLDQDQIRKVNETSKYADQEYNETDQLVAKLKKQLHKFIEERESWLDEINQRHTEMVSARIALEKLQLREQFLTTENEMLKMDNGKYKKAVMELEDEVSKLSQQHSLHQRIHHHAKIKEENKLLRIHNEDLHAKLERSDSMLSRVRDELARYRAACGKKPFVDIDEEEQLRKKLDDSEEERIQLDQELLSLRTCILRVAGLSKPLSAISPSETEDIICRIKEKMNSLESEVQDLKLKCKMFCEKIWLSELKQLQLQSPGHPGDVYHRGVERA